MSNVPRMTSVPDEGLPEYPIPTTARLDSHYFLQWNLKRWRGSQFRKKAYSDPEVGFFAFELFCKSQDETPLGTLPCDDRDLAFMLHLPLERWQALLKRDITPLQNWYKVQCDNGEIRWAHPVVELVAKEALKSSRSNAAKTEKRKRAKRITDLTSMLERIGCKHLLQNPGFVDTFNDWLECHHDGVQRTEKFIRPALEQFTVERGG